MVTVTHFIRQLQHNVPKRLDPWYAQLLTTTPKIRRIQQIDISTQYTAYQFSRASTMASNVVVSGTPLYQLSWRLVKNSASRPGFVV